MVITGETLICFLQFLYCLPPKEKCTIMVAIKVIKSEGEFELETKSGEGYLEKFEDILKYKLDKLNSENDYFSIKCNKFTTIIKYLNDNSFEVSITMINHGVVKTRLIGENWSKDEILDEFVKGDIAQKDEKEQFVQENIQEYLSSGSSSAYSSGYGTERIEDIVKNAGIPLEEKLLRTLYSERTFVLINYYYTDKRIMIVFDKVGDESAFNRKLFYRQK